MSSSLLWKPTTKEEGYLPDELKYALRKRCEESYITGITLTQQSVDYLEGLRDAGIKGAEDLIELIEKHGSIKLWESS